MIYDYEDKAGYVSLWTGKCKDYDVVDEYLTTSYFDSDMESTQQEIWKKLFLPSNISRPYKEELKESFSYGTFNQFEYDFGLSFDEDFREANVLNCDTKNFGELFDGFSDCNSFLEQVKALDSHQIFSCNTAVVLYDFQYTGDIKEVHHEKIDLYFLGYFKYET